MPIQKSPNLSTPQNQASRLRLDWNLPYFNSIDTTSDPQGLDEINSPDTKNTVYDSIQSVGSRKGYTKVLTTSLTNPIGGMYSLYQSTGVRQLLYASGTNLYIYNNAGGSTQISGTPTNFTTNQIWDFDEYQDSVYAGDGIDSFVAYNGSNYNIVNSAISPQFVKIRTNRVYCANKNSSTLYFSDAGDPTSFPVNNFIAINTNDGQNITGISDMLDNLIIFKDDSVWILTGEPVGSGNTTTIGNLQLKQANGTAGCSAFRTIAKVDTVIFFAHHSGIYALQNSSVSLVSPLLNTTFKSAMNPAFYNLMYAVYNDIEKKYILGYPSINSSTCDSAIVYDLLTKGFTIWDDIRGSCATNYRFSGLVDSVVIGDPIKGIIYEAFQGYADIAGANGTSTSGTTTTLTDSTQNWTPSLYVDARVGIVVNNIITYTAIITANTSTQITFTPALPVVASGLQYTIGYYDSYWVTKNFDFSMIGYTKKYRFFNLFCDSEIYNILFGYSVGFAPLTYQGPFDLSSNTLLWGQAGLVWGPSSGNWGSYSSEFAQANIGSTGTYIQVKFGNNLANQPWRAIAASFTYKLKKLRPNVVTTFIG